MDFGAREEEDIDISRSSKVGNKPSQQLLSVWTEFGAVI